MKECNKCHEVKPIDEFGKNKSYSSGYSNTCKSCINEASRKWNEDNKDKKRSRAQAYYLEKKEDIERKRIKRKSNNGRLSVERANELLKYDNETGALTWKLSTTNRIAVGDVAGTLLNCDEISYIQLMVDGKRFLAHRLIWLMNYGCFPASEIDHIDGNGLNNRLSNLRAVDRSGNSCNASISKRNTSGITGVWFSKRVSKWIAEIYLKGKKHRIGSFDNIDDARTARKEAEVKLHFHENHGRQR